MKASLVWTMAWMFLMSPAEAPAEAPALPVEPIPLQGIASWYSRYDRGVQSKTANGEKFNDLYATCASWHYPFGTYLKVTNVRSGKSVVVRVNDRGPKRKLNRVVDLTKGSFQMIAHPKYGVAKVSVQPVKKPA